MPRRGLADRAGKPAGRFKVEKGTQYQCAMKHTDQGKTQEVLSAARDPYLLIISCYCYTESGRENKAEA